MVATLHSLEPLAFLDMDLPEPQGHLAPRSHLEVMDSVVPLGHPGHPAPMEPLDTVDLQDPLDHLVLLDRPAQVEDCLALDSQSLREHRPRRNGYHHQRGPQALKALPRSDSGSGPCRAGPESRGWLMKNAA